VFGNMATGMAPKTDADGRFRINDLGRLECQAPATDAGITTGDEIIAINGMEVRRIGPQAAGLMLRFGRVKIGQELNLRVRRGDRVFDATVIATALPAEITDIP